MGSNSGLTMAPISKGKLSMKHEELGPLQSMEGYLTLINKKAASAKKRARTLSFASLSATSKFDDVEMVGRLLYVVLENELLFVYQDELDPNLHHDPISTQIVLDIDDHSSTQSSNLESKYTFSIKCESRNNIHGDEHYTLLFAAKSTENWQMWRRALAYAVINRANKRKGKAEQRIQSSGDW